LQSRPTKDASIPFVALRKYADLLNLSKSGVTVINTKKEGVKIARVATIAPFSIPPHNIFTVISNDHA
jgi:hypothetical protein